LIKDSSGREIYVEIENGQHRPATEAEYNEALGWKHYREALESQIDDLESQLRIVNANSSDSRVFYDEHGPAGTLRHFIAKGTKDLI